MQRTSRVRFCRFSLCGLLLAVVVIPVSAQVTPPRVRPGASRDSESKTSVSFVLLVGRQGVGLKAQEWSRVFGKMNVRVRIRRGTPADKIEVRETKLGRFRSITVTGTLERDGKIVFADRSFTRRDSGKIAEWIRELKTYGKQGTPDGKPLWGLSKGQFGSVFTALSAVARTDVTGQPLKRAVAAINTSKTLPIRFSVDADRWLSSKFQKEPNVRHQIQLHSVGTALAIVLHDAGLGFRPLRTPAGKLELVVEPLTTTMAVWPIGWPPKGSKTKIAPTYYKMVPVELDKVDLVDVLNAVAIKTKVRVHIDYASLAAENIDISKIKVSYARRQASWSVMLRGITVPHKLKRELLTDELGRPFLWIKPLRSTRRKR